MNTVVITLRFRFRLDSILRLKAFEEERAREELIEVRSRIRSLESELENLENMKKDVESEMSKRLESGMSGGEIEKWMTYVKGIEGEMERKLEEMERLREEESEKLKSFLEKRRERKALEKLRERRLREHLEELDFRERRFLDEIAQRRHWWKT